MRPRPLLLTAAAALTVVHVIGVLFARPLFRPAELLATLCLLACAIRADLPAGRGRPWGLSVATAVLVAGAALTVPAPGAVAGWQVLAPEEYAGLTRRAQLTSLAQVTAALLFVLVLLVMAVRRAENRRRPGRAVVGAAIVAALLVIGYVVMRAVVIVSASRAAGRMSQPLGVATVLPLLLGLAALALAVTTVTHRQWRAAAGAVLFVAVAVIWIDAAIGAVALPYEVREYAELFALDLITSTDSVPEPTRALITALQLTAAILIVAGLSGAGDPRREWPAGGEPVAGDPPREG